MLFIDARHIYRQIDRAHRDWTEAQISFLANIVRLYRDEKPDFTLGGDDAKEKLLEIFAAIQNPKEAPQTKIQNTPMFPASVAPPRSRKSKHKAGRSTPAATWAWPPAKP